MADEHQRPASRDARAESAVRAPTHAERCRTLVLKRARRRSSTLRSRPRGLPVRLARDGRDRRRRPSAVACSPRSPSTRGNLLARSGDVDPDLRAARPARSAARARPRHDPRAITVEACRTPSEPRCARRSSRRSPSASYYVDFKDFAFYRLEPIGAALRRRVRAHVVGDRGRLSRGRAGPARGVGRGHPRSHERGPRRAVLAYARVLAGVADASARR